MLDQAFESLKKLDWGSDPKTLQPIDDAIVASHGDDAARRELETKLLEHLEGGTDASRDFVYRKLRVIGTAASVPALAERLSDAKQSHMARYALESMPADEAGAALRDALQTVQGENLIGVISSVGARRDEASVETLGKLAASDDEAISQAAACALGRIGNSDAAKALATCKSPAAIDASLACAESLVSNGQRADAIGIYLRLAKSPQKHVKLAATRGMLNQAE